MKLRRYLLVKLAEEAAELAQAALKHLQHGDATSLSNLHAEAGDVRGLLYMCNQYGITSSTSITDAKDARIKREQTRPGV